MKKIYLVCLLFIVSLSCKAAVVKGLIKDASNNELILEAFIDVPNTTLFTEVGLDGSYALQNVPVDTFTVRVRSIGYKTQIKKVTITKADEALVVDFLLEPEHVKEIVITGTLDPESDNSAKNREKKADNIMNVVSAETIRLLPDITVANVLQRISGVSVLRNNTGDGQYAIIRGMDKRYNYTLINGIKIPSPDDKNRYVPMDIFPADMVGRLEIVKALTPNMEGDAIGGAMNVVMKTAPEKFLFNANLSPGFNQMFFTNPFVQFDYHAINPQSPVQLHGTSYDATPADFQVKSFEYSNKKLPISTVGSFSVGNRFLNKKLGAIFGFSYQNNFRAAHSVYDLPDQQPLPNTTHIPTPTFSDIYVRQYSVQTTRYGTQAKFDYIINKRNTITLYNAFLYMREVEERHTVDTSLSGGGRAGPGTGQVDILDRSRLKIQTIYNSTLEGNHMLLDNLKFNWHAVLSNATNNVPDWSELDVEHNVNFNSAHQSVSSTPLLQPMTRRWLANSDRDLTGYANLTYTPKIAGQEVEFAVGGMDRHKLRVNRYYEYDFNPAPVNGQTQQPYSNVNNAHFQFTSSTGGYGDVPNRNTYIAQENILAYYTQAKTVFFKKLQVLGGVRTENTYQYYATAEPITFAATYGTITYTDLLPSLHFKHMINDKQNLRLSYFKAINRPSYFEITPYYILGDYFTETGNPYLKHAVAHNFDLRYEFFPKSTDQVLVGIFYKKIVNPIEIAYVVQNLNEQVLQPNNFGTATNYGFEAVVTKYIKYFGVSLNYTYTNSSMTTTKKTIYKDTTGQTVSALAKQTRPMEGQANNIANASLLYKNNKKGLDLQLALVYTGSKIVMVSPYLDQDYWQRPITQLDFSFEKTFAKKFSCFGKVNNILNSPLIVEVKLPNIYRSGTEVLPDQTSNSWILVQKEYYKQTYLCGIRYKF